MLESESLLELIFDILRDKVVVGKFHGVVSATLGHGLERRDVLEHVGQRNLRTDGFDVVSAIT
jgi:hypothetical protein